MNLSVSKSSQLLSSRKGQGISCSRFRWAVPSPARNRAADPPASAPAAGGDAVVRRASRVHATDAAGVRDAARRRAAILIAERPRRSEADCGPRMAASTQTSGRAEGVLQAGECAPGAAHRVEAAVRNVQNFQDAENQRQPQGHDEEPGGINNAVKKDGECKHVGFRPK